MVHERVMCKLDHCLWIRGRLVHPNQEYNKKESDFYLLGLKKSFPHKYAIDREVLYDYLE
jgi:hypothetical protein